MVPGSSTGTSREVQNAYLREQDLVQRDSERRRQRVFARLFEDRALGGDELATIAAELDVLVMLGSHDDTACPACAALGPGAFVFELARTTCHFRRAGTGMGSLAGQRVVVIRDLLGLEQMRAAVETGKAILLAQPGAPAPATVHGAWPLVARRSLTAALPAETLPIDFAALDASPPGECAQLERAVRVFLATGSIKETAARLYCHRNTIVNRIARFEGLVGVDLSVRGCARGAGARGSVRRRGRATCVDYEHARPSPS